MAIPSFSVSRAAASLPAARNASAALTYAGANVGSSLRAAARGVGERRVLQRRKPFKRRGAGDRRLPDVVRNLRERGGRARFAFLGCSERRCERLETGG